MLLNQLALEIYNQSADKCREKMTIEGAFQLCCLS
jgi:hypothetical protein